jgi:hypothetical protein
MTWLLIISAMTFTTADANVKVTTVSSTPYTNKGLCQAAASRFNNATRHPANQVASCEPAKV